MIRHFDAPDGLLACGQDKDVAFWRKEDWTVHKDYVTCKECLEEINGGAG